jgi:hypothetical protein
LDQARQNRAFARPVAAHIYAGSPGRSSQKCTLKLGVPDARADPPFWAEYKIWIIARGDRE